MWNIDDNSGMPWKIWKYIETKKYDEVENIVYYQEQILECILNLSFFQLANTRKFYSDCFKCN